VEVIHLRESTLSLIRLSDFFGIEAKSRDDGHFYVVVVNTGMRRAGIVVEVLIGQEEAVIKPLVDYLQEKSGFSGATILGDGRISLILDVYELINMSIGRKLQNTDFIIGQPDATDAGRPYRRPAAAGEAEKRS
jgi:two-component system chemotaxis sensor kinase CheA